MPAGSTYSTIATLNGTGSSGTISFTSIPSNYTDLVLEIVPWGLTDGIGVYTRLNNDSTTLYSTTVLLSTTGSAGNTQRQVNQNLAILGGWTIGAGTSLPSTIETYFNNYSNSTTLKNFLSRYTVSNNSNQIEVGIVSGLYRSSSAINRIDVIAGAGNWSTNASATLYGITAA